MMPTRSLLLLVFLVLVSSPLFSQLQKGSTIQFGTSDLSYRPPAKAGTDGRNYSEFDTYISYGLLYFLSDHWAVGGSLGDAAVSNIRESRSGILPGIRYYFNPQVATLHWFAGTSAGIELTIGDQAEISLERWNLGAGFNHLLNESIMLEVGANIAFRNGNRSFFRYPEWNLGAGLQVYLSPEGRKNKKSALPAIGRGSWLAGLSEAGLSYQPLDEDVTFTLSVQPTAGYFVTDRWVVGLGLQASYTKLRFNSEFPDFLLDYSVRSLGMEALTRYYVGAPDKRLRPFALARIGFSHTASNYINPRQPPTINSTNAWLTARGGAGANLFLSPRAALEASLTYSLGKTQTPDAMTFDDNRFGLNFGFQFFLGGTKE